MQRAGRILSSCCLEAGSRPTKSARKVGAFCSSSNHTIFQVKFSKAGFDFNLRMKPCLSEHRLFSSFHITLQSAWTSCGRSGLLLTAALAIASPSLCAKFLQWLSKVKIRWFLDITTITCKCCCNYVLELIQFHMVLQRTVTGGDCKPPINSTYSGRVKLQLSPSRWWRWSHCTLFDFWCFTCIFSCTLLWFTAGLRFRTGLTNGTTIIKVL